MSQSLDVCPATPLILFYDVADYQNAQIDGMTWDGQRSGKITVIPNAESSNPDGTRLVAFPNINDSGTRRELDRRALGE